MPSIEQDRPREHYVAAIEILNDRVATLEREVEHTRVRLEHETAGHALTRLRASVLQGALDEIGDIVEAASTRAIVTDAG